VARDPEESRIGESRFPEIRDSCMLDSRSAIYRQDLSRPSEGQVSEIKAPSEFDASKNWSFQGHGMLATGNRDPRFPDRINTVHQRGRVARDPRKLEFGISEFQES
jgi:hypothetical protein